MQIASTESPLCYWVLKTPEDAERLYSTLIEGFSTRQIKIDLHDPAGRHGTLKCFVMGADNTSTVPMVGYSTPPIPDNYTTGDGTGLID